MENKIQIDPIGHIKAENHTFSIHIDEKFRDGLININGFTHLQIVWWGNLYDAPEHRMKLIEEKCYTKGPDQLGVFATRSQIRPNPVLITTVFVQKIDLEKGIIHTPYMDAENNTPVLDIKPYHRIERIRECGVPAWCDHWPKWYEDAANFDWAAEFNF